MKLNGKTQDISVEVFDTDNKGENVFMSKRGILSLNLLADNDYRDTISYLVNGSSNGFADRINYVKQLKIIFHYE